MVVISAGYTAPVAEVKLQLRPELPVPPEQRPQHVIERVAYSTVPKANSVSAIGFQSRKISIVVNRRITGAVARLTQISVADLKQRPLRKTERCGDGSNRRGRGFRTGKSEGNRAPRVGAGGCPGTVLASSEPVYRQRDIRRAGRRFALDRDAVTGAAPHRQKVSALAGVCLIHGVRNGGGCARGRGIYRQRLEIVSRRRQIGILGTDDSAARSTGNPSLYAVQLRHPGVVRAHTAVARSISCTMLA